MTDTALNSPPIASIAQRFKSIRTGFRVNKPLQDAASVQMLSLARTNLGVRLRAIDETSLTSDCQKKIYATVAETLKASIPGFPTLDNRIDEKLGHPDRCPHGWPVDTVFEQAENEELEPLSALEPGSDATIVRLAEHDGDLLHWFYDEGLVPGTAVELRAAEPAAGQFRVAVDGGEKAIGEKAAAGLFVKRA